MCYVKKLNGHNMTKWLHRGSTSMYISSIYYIKIAGE